MTEPRSLGHCHACGYKLSEPRLRALLRRRQLERFVGLRGRQTHEQLAQLVTEAGHPASRLTVLKDLKLASAARAAEIRYQLARTLKES